MTRYRWLTVVAAAAALAGVACGGGSGGKSGAQGNLSVSARSGATAPTMGGSLDLGNGILVSEIRLAVAKVALESGQDGGDASDSNMGTHGAATMADHGGGDGGGGGDAGGQGENDEVKVGPCLIDLTGNQLTAGGSAVSPVCASDIPTGTFQELEVDIAPVAAAAAGVAGLGAMNGKSVIVDGTFNGTAFSFQSTLEVRQKTEATVTVSASSNVTITIDPTGWFTAPGGGVLDPTVAADQGAIEGNIRASIRSFEDDNRDGQDDGDHGGGGGGGGMGGM